MTNTRTEGPVVRNLVTADLDGLLTLYTDIGLVKVDDLRQQMEQTWARILATDLLHYFGVFIADTLVATCHAVIVPNLSRGVRPYAIIENVGTLSTHRRQGHAKLVMQAAVARCWEAGCYKVMLASGLQNTRAHAFYEAIGFSSGAKQSFVLTRPNDV